MGDAHLLGPLDGQGLQRALPDQPGQGPDRPVDRLRPAHPDRLRPRRPGGRRRGGQGRRPGRPPRPHGRAARPDPGRVDEHVDDHQRHRGVAARPLHRQRRGPGRRPPGAVGHHPERHRQGVPVPGDLHLPAAPEPPADRRHHRLHGAPRAQVEPDQRLQLPPAGGRGDAPPGGRLRPGHRHRRARRGARLGPDPGRGVPRGGRADLLLRQRRGAVRRGDLQDAGLHRTVGPGVHRALRGRPIPSCGGCATACRSTRSG